MAQYDGSGMSAYGMQTLPHSLEAEQSVLGAVLIAPGCFAQVLERIGSRHFFREQHAAMFDVMAVMFQQNKPMDAVTILNEVLSAGVFATPEEAKMYLANLAQIVPTASNVEAYCRIMQDKYISRQVLLTAQEIMDAAGAAGNGEELLDLAEQKIYEIRQGRGTGSFVHIRKAVAMVYESLQRLVGDDADKFKCMSSGFPDLDRMITGLNPSDLILIAARPGMGKTAIALNIAYHAAVKQKKTVAIFSLEMSNEQLATRFMSGAASIESQKFRKGDLNDDEWVRLPMVSDQLVGVDIFLDDSAGITVGEMKAKLRRLQNVDLVVIDYLQLMSSGKKRTENRVQEVSEITRSLKIMAKDLNVPLITLSQLSRGPESRADKRPMLSDLRESGSIEQDADIVLMLYREDYYMKEEAKEHNVAICTVAKNRHGDVGDVRLGWDGRFTRFTTLEYKRDEP